MSYFISSRTSLYSSPKREGEKPKDFLGVSHGFRGAVFLNLPREQRFKWENIIVAGIVLEMSKEPKSLNTFLAPIVDELKAFWIGVKLKTIRVRYQ